MNDWRPSSGPDIARRRAERLAVVRQFFAGRGVLEVDVPALVRAPVTDINIDSLVIRDAVVAGRQDLYLHTSPEYAMKRLLAAGYPDIFSIARVFRDGELGRQHEPEFTLVEWYRRDFDLDAMARESCELVAAVLERPELEETASVRYLDAFEEVFKLDPLDADVDALAELANADAGLRDALGERRDAWLDLLLSTRIVPQFARDRLTVLSHYPRSQAALSRVDPDDERVALRFEVFLGSTELANGYVELLDADEQRVRFENDRREREAEGKLALPVDEAMLAALDHGLPDCAGVALGFERLHMLYEGVDAISDVIPFSFGQQEND